MDTHSEIEKLKGLAQEAGFTVIDLADVYDGQDLDALRVSAWDVHPNKEGNRLIAERLSQVLNSDPQFQALRERNSSSTVASGGSS